MVSNFDLNTTRNDPRLQLIPLFFHSDVNVSRKAGGIININTDVSNTYHDKHQVFLAWKVYGYHKILIVLQWIFSNVVLVQ